MSRILFFFISFSLYQFSLAQTISATGSMNTARLAHKSYTLDLFNVLVFGGEDNNSGNLTILSSAEIYNVSTQTWTYTGSMNQPRSRFASAVLATTNPLRPMAIGGVDLDSMQGKRSCELYNPSTSTWTFTGSLNVPRFHHACIRLTNGDILVAGGSDDNTAEVFNKFSDVWTFTGPMNEIRHSGASIVNLPDGKVLVTGGASDLGNGSNTAEVYNPSTNTWTMLSSQMAYKRYFHKSILLDDGKVLICGGEGPDLSTIPFTTEIFDPVTNQFSPGPSLTEGRNYCDLIKMYNGNVLVFGIGDPFNPLDTKCIEIYNLTSGSWTSGTYDVLGSQGYTINTIANNKILIAGGSVFSSLASTNLCYEVSSPTCVAADLTKSVTGGVICYGNSGTVVISESQAGYRYQAYIGSSSVTSAVLSSGGTLDLTIPSNRLAVGTNTITIKAGSVGCTLLNISDTAQIKVIQVLPTPIVNPSGTTSICQGDSILLSAPVGYSEYSWSNSKNTSSVWIKTAGSYKVKVTDQNGCISSVSANTSIIVNSLPEKPFAGFDETVCETHLEFYLNPSPFPTATTRIWSGSEVTSDGKFNPQVSGPGSYQATFTVTNSSGCSSSDTKNIYVLANISGQKRIYVKQDATGANDGTSWTNAYTDLQSALTQTSHCINEIWVAAGVYKPHSSDRLVSFILNKGVNLYGGFNGTESSLEQRDLSNNVTILSGELGTSSVADNTNNIIIASNANGELNGFRIINGYAKIVAPLALDYYMNGGGIFMNGGYLKVKSCWFLNNKADYNGGAVYLNYIENKSKLEFYNCIFSGNQGSYSCIYGNSKAINCTFSTNESPMHSVTTTNCILWGNYGSGGCGNSTMINCIVQSLCRSAGTMTNGNIDINPMFVDADGTDNDYGTLDDDLRLLPGSPAVNAGTPDTSNLFLSSYDALGEARIHQGKIDIGAIESQQPQPIIYVKLDATGANNGTSWTDAYTDLKRAIHNAPFGSSIWVAQGTYYPVYNNDPNARGLSMKYNVAIYGGFNGTESDFNQRDYLNNLTILSGDIGVTGDSLDNSMNIIYNQAITDYTVDSNPYPVTVVQMDSTAVLDGFIIEKGYGGNIFYNSYVSPTIQNCIFRENSSNGESALYNHVSLPTLINCTFINNKNRSNNGSAMNNFLSSPTVKSCSFISNSNGCAVNCISIHSSGKVPVFENCEFRSNYSNSSPTALCIQNTIVKDCSFIENYTTFPGQSEDISGSAIGKGSAVLAINGTQLVNCLFKKNTTFQSAPAIYAADTMLISKCTFDSNYAANGKGVVYVDYGVVKISDCFFDSNRDYFSKSAGIFKQSGKLEVERTTFYRNEGSAIYDSTGSTWINSCKFFSNNSVTGAGIYSRTNQTKIVNSIFTNNEALDGSSFPNAGSGGAITIYGSEISNCSFYSNKASSANAVYNIFPSFPTIKNCIVWNSGNNAFLNYLLSGNKPVFYSIIQNGPYFSGTNILTDNPLFNDPDGADNVIGTLDDNLSVACNSNAINAGGADTTGLRLSDIDINGNERFMGGKIDIGAYENPSTGNPIVKNDTICGSGTLTLSALGTTEGNFRWYASSSGGNAFSTSSVYSVNLSSPQTVTYYVSLYSDGCESQRSEIKGISYPIPQTPIVEGSSTVCENDSISLNVKDPEEKYLWNSGETTQIIKVKNSGVWNVKVTNMYGCESTISTDHTITMLPAPVVPLITELNGSLETSEIGINYEWKKNNMVIAGQNNQALLPDGSGIFNVRYEDNNGCYSNFSPDYNFILTSIKTGKQTVFSISPNPASDHILIIPDKKFTNGIITVFDLEGKVVHETAMSQGTTFELDVSLYAQGVYYLHIKLADDIWITRILIE